MTLQPLVLDDLDWQQMVEAIRRRVPAESGGTWTLHSPVDPGITLLELFAYLLEQRLFSLDQVPDALVLAVLRLLGLDDPKLARPGRHRAPAARRAARRSPAGAPGRHRFRPGSAAAGGLHGRGSHDRAADKRRRDPALGGRPGTHRGPGRAAAGAADRPRRGPRRGADRAAAQRRSGGLPETRGGIGALAADPDRVTGRVPGGLAADRRHRRAAAGGPGLVLVFAGRRGPVSRRRPASGRPDNRPTTAPPACAAPGCSGCRCRRPGARARLARRRRPTGCG